MQEIIRYLSNPLQTGVNTSLVTADFFIMPKFIDKVVDVVKTDKINNDEEIIEELNGVLGEVNAEYFPFMGDYAFVFSKAIRILGETMACPKEVKAYLESPFDINNIELLLTRMKIAAIDASLKSRLEFYFSDEIFEDINDVLSINAIEINHKRQYAFEIIGVKEQGIERFTEYLKHVPEIGKTVRVLKAEKSFSAKYALRPYPLAVRLWLNNNSLQISENCKHYLKGSVNYISEREWRTGAVLSAIALENVLAELCEEKHIKPKNQHGDTLGGMFYNLRDKIAFPQQVKEAFKTVNQARILAVHRNQRPVSKKVATDALFGSVKFILWYYSEYKQTPQKEV